MDYFGFRVPGLEFRVQIRVLGFKVGRLMLRPQALWP